MIFIVINVILKLLSQLFLRLILQFVKLNTRDLIADFPILRDFLSQLSSAPDSCCINNSTLNKLRTIWDEVLMDFNTKNKELDNNKKTSAFVRNVQHDFSVFIDQLYVQQSRFSPCSNECLINKENQLKDIALEVRRILGYLLRKYPEYFDFNRVVPDWVIVLNHKSVIDFDRIIDNLQTKSIDPELLEIISEYLKCLFIPNKFKMKTWRQYVYLDLLVTELDYFSELPKTHDDNKNLLKLLVGRNFNPIELHDYVIRFFTKILPRDKSYEEQEMELLTLLKVIKQTRIETIDVYNNEAQPIYNSVCDFINGELESIGKMKDVLTSYATESVTTGKSNYFFEFCTTIEELIFLTQVMLEVRLIKTKFRSNLYTFISKHIKTERSKNPSTGYMRALDSPKYEFQAKTIRRVRSWLTNMVSYIDENYKNQTKMFNIPLLNMMFVFEIMQTL